jgi:hypothetical protein
MRERKEEKENLRDWGESFEPTNKYVCPYVCTCIRNGLANFEPLLGSQVLISHTL